MCIEAWCPCPLFQQLNRALQHGCDPSPDTTWQDQRFREARHPPAVGRQACASVPAPAYGPLCLDETQPAVRCSASDGRHNQWRVVSSSPDVNVFTLPSTPCVHGCSQHIPLSCRKMYHILDTSIPNGPFKKNSAKLATLATRLQVWHQYGYGKDKIMKNLHLMRRMVTQTLHQCGCATLPLMMHIAFPSCPVVGLVFCLMAVRWLLSMGAGHVT